jgi:RNA polymerase sigma-70 factor (ECF subfamily)
VLYARQVLAAEDRGQAEDVIQELFVRLFAQAGGEEGLPEPPNPAAWLHRCVRNACLDHRRTRVRRVNREQGVATAKADWFELHADDLIDARAAQAALASLPDLQRQVVSLRIWSGLTFAEVADLTGHPVSTVHDQYRRALASLRSVLESRSSHAQKNATE